MKYLFLATILLLTGFVYFFIPKSNTIISEIKPACSIGTVQRITGSSDYRIKWLPKAGKTVSATEYIFDGCSFLFADDNSFNNNVTVKYKNINANCLFTFETAGDSVLVKWLFTHQSSNNPISRFTDYFALKHIKATNQKILQSMLAFFKRQKKCVWF